MLKADTFEEHIGIFISAYSKSQPAMFDVEERRKSVLRRDGATLLL